MARLFGFIGTTIGSSLGWWLGAHVGLVTAVCMSAIGAGTGLWAGARLASEYLP